MTPKTQIQPTYLDRTVRSHSSQGRCLLYWGQGYSSVPWHQQSLCTCRGKVKE